MAVPNFPGFNRAARRCSGNWFSDPEELRVGTQYWFREFDTGRADKLKFEGIHEVWDTYLFTYVPSRFDERGIERIIEFEVEGFEDGCFREIVTPVQEGGGKRKQTRRRRKGIKKTKRRV